VIFTYAGCGYLGGKPSAEALEWADDDLDKLVLTCARKMLRERNVQVAWDDGLQLTVNNNWELTCRHTTDPTLLLTDRMPMENPTDFVLWGHQLGEVMLILGVISRGRLTTHQSARQLLTTEEWLRAFRPDPFDERTAA
jgi:hypothetical protein